MKPPPGMHMMPDGKLMKDSDMNRDMKIKKLTVKGKKSKKMPSKLLDYFKSLKK